MKFSSSTHTHKSKRQLLKLQIGGEEFLEELTYYNQLELSTSSKSNEKWKMDADEATIQFHDFKKIQVQKHNQFQQLPSQSCKIKKLFLRILKYNKQFHIELLSIPQTQDYLNSKDIFQSFFFFQVHFDRKNSQLKQKQNYIIHNWSNNRFKKFQEQLMFYEVILKINCYLS
ncbi:unnamed protein product (macronuclear) [Paramecium tetraurelia]|uniref:Uncharacterized protein n=1 Tax=Paramecium tetraurelia TaxID=5888 RepID=A0BE87_PARTE|nr:uncharacterized protein GSPATT00027887001 [Paramecium tetraurelia]CAK56854.1 unnamed protein product [Paramecium tetraurelia]|eukprot:XP_001424252.1 hypothetical protein (macronuclear) [Paramecium tetraurelia strain d4-2]